jgi:hypothetical protein
LQRTSGLEILDNTVYVGASGTDVKGLRACLLNQLARDPICTMKFTFIL